MSLGPRSVMPRQHPSGSNAVPASVRSLVTRHITSVAQLEILLLARRTKERTWNADDVSRELRTSPQSSSLHLDELVREGFLERASDGYRYVASGKLDAAVAELERAYATYRTRIVKMIFD